MASGIAFAFVSVHAATIEPSSRDAARFLDRAIGTKDHFLTLATADPAQPLMAVVAEETARVAAAAAVPALPPPRKKPLIASVILSIAGFLLLLFIPGLSSLASGGGELDRIAAELAAAGDADLAAIVRETAAALRDPKLSNREKHERIEEAIHKIENTQRDSARSGRQGQSQPGGKDGNQGEKQAGGRQGGNGSGNQQSSAAERQAAGQGKGSGAADARERAKQELSKLAGQMGGGEQSQTKAGEQNKGEQKQQPSGGGIKGPESGKDRKNGDRDVAGNQPGSDPRQSGGSQKPGGSEGEAKSEQSGDRSQQGPTAQQARPAGSGGEGAGQRPSSQPDGKPAEKYYKPGEGPGDGVKDGRYVRVRIPEESKTLPGTETVAKPGEILPEVPFGNAPLPSAGAPDQVSADQPVPLEYREVLTGH